MFYHLFAPLADSELLGVNLFNVFRYITFRSVMAFITGLVYTLTVGPVIIRQIKKKQALELISEYLLELGHKDKANTPSMGGIIFLSGVLITSLLWNNLTNHYIILMYLVTIWLGGVGFLDDYLKNIRKEKQGLIVRYKLLGQIILGLFVAMVLITSPIDKSTITTICIPFFKNLSLNIFWLFIPFTVLMIVGTSNGTNLTDGLDGLATGTISIALLGLGIMSYIKGNFINAGYLNLEFIPQAGELTVFIAALVGSLLGFLWFNCKPAQIFMGDTGSLALGGQLAVIAIILREEIFFLIIGGIFVVESLSSLIQIRYFQYTKKKYGKGRWFFKMAPLHHHYQKKGFTEDKIVVRFWIIALMLLAIGLSTIKLR
ncbi:MAG: phospho-N-acetylmuramoyl-pentapeptide-transferase [Candidatus Cloacimonetes bacterium]|nr:phospho-N-acetylmuramoyl-pentapeptide-transferase [Candidatus Cloacimonadota bacterium]